MNKKISLFCCALLLVSMCGCAAKNPTPTATPASPSPTPGATESLPPSAPAGTVSDYYPIRENVRYVYQGEGNEYASYDVYIDYTSETKIQQRVNNGGTVMANVIEVKDGKVTRIYRQEDSYYRENALNKTSDTQEILLMEPLVSGTTWTLSDGRTRTITGTDVNVETPLGNYSAVAVETSGTGWKNTDYYAKNIGLVKSVFTSDGSEVTSSLSEIEEDVSFTQSVRFYYPNINDSKIYYKDRDVSFRTNDITKKVLETTYKEQISGQPATVFSANTKINSLYLNKDGMVYLDLSKEFVSEMNAGSAYESMILQCVANTFGNYYNADKVILTIDNNLYESGHFKFEKGEHLDVKTDGSVPIA